MDAKTVEKNQIKEKYCLIIIAAIILFHLINNYFWIEKDCSLSGKDVIEHLRFQVLFHNQFLNEVWNNNQCPFLKRAHNLLLMFRESTEQPYLVYLVSSIFNVIFGKSLRVTVLASFFYFIILIYATYLLGKELYGKTAGVLAAFIISTYPCLAGLSRKYGLDLPLTAMVALCIYFLLKSNYFNSRKYALFFGLAFALGVLTKIQIIFFILGPLSYIAYYFLKYQRKALSKEDKRRIIINFIISMSIPVCVIFIWLYGGMFQYTIGHFFSHHFIFNRENQDPGLFNIFSIKQLLYYPVGIVTNMTPFYFILLIVGIIYFARNITQKSTGLILLWVVIPYLIFTILISPKYARYYFPVYPVFALITANAILKTGHKKTKMLACFAIIIIALFQIMILSWTNLGRIFIPDFLTRTKYMQDCRSGEWCHTPSNSNTEQVTYRLANIIKDKRPQNTPINVGILYLSPCNRGLIPYYLQFSQPDIFLYDYEIYFSLNNDTENFEFYKNMKTLHYLLVIDTPSLKSLKFDILTAQFPAEASEFNSMMSYFANFTLFKKDMFFYAGRHYSIYLLAKT